MEIVWTGPAPDAKTVVSPTHTLTWIGTGYPMIPMPIGPEGHKVAFIFPDNDSAVVAARQLAAIGDQSVIDAQRRANSINGRPRDDGIIFGEHPAIGKFATLFRVLVRNSVSPDQPGHCVQRPQFTGVNWRPMHLAILDHSDLMVAKLKIETQQPQWHRLLLDHLREPTTLQTAL
ncbi:MAG: hypothetical protein R3C01_01735 [Planctomycetaceae bacterium]